MAFGLRHWVGWTVAACGGLAVWLLPPGPAGAGAPEARLVRPGDHLPEVRRSRALARDLLRLETLRQRSAWLDSLAPLTVAEADGIRVDPRGLDPEELGAFEKDLARAFEPVPGGRRVHVGLFALDRNRWAPGQGWHPVEAHVGEEGGVSYCLMVEVAPGRDARITSGLVEAMMHGPCALYARHGPPGPEVRRWLRRTLHRNARNARAIPSDWVAPERRAVLFGAGRGYENLLHPAGERCLAGRLDACREAVLGRPDEETWWGRVGDQWLQSHLGVGYVNLRFPPVVPRFGEHEQALLFELEREFGREAFSRFWRSEKEVPEAFREAFGRPLGVWVRDWARGQFGTLRAGPAPPPSTGSLSLLAVLICGAVAVGFARRRTVG